MRANKIIHYETVWETSHWIFEEIYSSIFYFDIKDDNVEDDDDYWLMQDLGRDTVFRLFLYFFLLVYTFFVLKPFVALTWNLLQSLWLCDFVRLLYIYNCCKIITFHQAYTFILTFKDVCVENKYRMRIVSTNCCHLVEKMFFQYLGLLIDVVTFFE